MGGQKRVGYADGPGLTSERDTGPKWRKNLRGDWRGELYEPAGGYDSGNDGVPREEGRCPTRVRPRCRGQSRDRVSRNVTTRRGSRGNGGTHVRVTPPSSSIPNGTKSRLRLSGTLRPTFLRKCLVGRANRPR